ATRAWLASSAGCRGPMAHAVAECGGFPLPVAQYTPGFEPIALAWGWGLLGVLCGVLVGLYFEPLAHRAASLVAGRGRPAQAVTGPPGLTAMPPWRPTVRGELAAATGRGSGQHRGLGRVTPSRVLRRDPFAGVRVGEAPHPRPVGDHEFLRDMVDLGFTPRPVGEVVAALGFAEQSEGVVVGFAAPTGGQSRPPSPGPGEGPPAAATLPAAVGQGVEGAPLGGERPAMAVRPSDGFPNMDPLRPVVEVPPLPLGRLPTWSRHLLSQLATQTFDVVRTNVGEAEFDKLIEPIASLVKPRAEKVNAEVDALNQMHALLLMK
ncbi:unnamed protein product, partial [Prorocentrum cordatum]